MTDNKYKCEFHQGIQDLYECAYCMKAIKERYKYMLEFIKLLADTNTIPLDEDQYILALDLRIEEAQQVLQEIGE